jgi:Tol biopolymer transport system component
MVSVRSDGTQGDIGAAVNAISADGRFVAFTASSTNLVPGDTNDENDVFIHDRRTRRTSLVSVAVDGGPANGVSDLPSISADGRYVAFESRASNLVAGDSNGDMDVFVRDLRTGTTSRASVLTGGYQASDGGIRPAISGNGRYVVFESTDMMIGGEHRPGILQIAVHDRMTNTTTGASRSRDGGWGDDASMLASISSDGTHVAFFSSATNLVADVASPAGQVYVRDMRSGRTVRASVSPDGAPGNDQSGYLSSLSADGRSAWPPMAPRATGPASFRQFPRTGGMSPFLRLPPTW